MSCELKKDEDQRMRTVSTMALAIAILAACTPIAVVADSSKPGHCVAALNIWYTIAEQSAQPKSPKAVRFALAVKARIIWELAKIQIEGSRSDIRESERLSRQLLLDPQGTDALAKACLQSQDQDPSFQRANHAGLMSLARSAPVGTADPAFLSSVHRLGEVRSTALR